MKSRACEKCFYSDAYDKDTAICTYLTDISSGKMETDEAFNENISFFEFVSKHFNLVGDVYRVEDVDDEGFKEMKIAVSKKGVCNKFEEKR